MYTFFRLDQLQSGLRLEAHKIRFFNSRMPDVVTKGDISYTFPPEW